jgi:hypothetical protein
MNELECDYVAAKAFGLETLVLLLRLWVILFCVFTGLWVLGVIIMFWWAAIPIALIGAWWFLNSDAGHEAGDMHLRTVTEDECAVRTPDDEFKGFNSAQGSLN